MDVFKGQNLLEFSDRFKTDDDCKEYLASIKAKSAYKCTRCNHSACQIRKDFGRQCNICADHRAKQPYSTTLSPKWCSERKYINHN
jgi:hypothetical protein